MILMALFNVLFGLLKVLFSWLSLPDFPQELTSVVDGFFEYVSDGMGLLWLFLDKQVVIICLPIALACSNFDKIYDLLMWILAKLPIGINKN